MIWAVSSPEISAAVEEIIRSRSDRVVAIVGGAMIDRALRRSLEVRLRVIEKVTESFFAPDGPLGTYSSRYKLAYLLNAIDKPTYTAMVGLGRIRNAFAHQLDIRFSAGMKEMKGGFDQLQLHRLRAFYPHPFLDQDTKERVRQRPRSRREQFLVNLRIMMALLMRDNVWRIPGQL